MYTSKLKEKSKKKHEKNNLLIQLRTFSLLSIFIGMIYIKIYYIYDMCWYENKTIVA